MKLSKLSNISGQIELVTGLHIGSGNTEMHIGGTDNPVIKNPVTHEPYIPGSSIKGKMRSLLEWHVGVVGITDGKPLGYGHLGKIKVDAQGDPKKILKLFGGAPEGVGQHDEIINEIGPTRLSFWDCALTKEWVENMRKNNLLLTETKMENTINRIAGTAENPRNTERVPAGAKFGFQLTMRIHDEEDLTDMVLRGLRLLELSGLGGSGSRGYGKLKFNALSLNGQPIQQRLESVSI